MPYVYQVYVEYYDEEEDRFWFSNQQVISDEPIPGYQVFRETDLLIAAQLAGSQYEALRQFIASERFEPVETITAIYYLPSG